jgi:hypothetical protein
LLFKWCQVVPLRLGYGSDDGWLDSEAELYYAGGVGVLVNEAGGLYCKLTSAVDP